MHFYSTCATGKSNFKSAGVFTVIFIPIPHLPIAVPDKTKLFFSFPFRIFVFRNTFCFLSLALHLKTLE